MEKSPKPQAPILCIQALWNFDGATLDQKKKNTWEKLEKGKSMIKIYCMNFFINKKMKGRIQGSNMMSSDASC